jgi:hypothetical protein
VRRFPTPSPPRSAGGRRTSWSSRIQPPHRIPGFRRSPLEASLVCWADSYDAMIFYREVTPLAR